MTTESLPPAVRNTCRLLSDMIAADPGYEYLLHVIPPGSWSTLVFDTSKDVYAARKEVAPSVRKHHVGISRRVIDLPRRINNVGLVEFHCFQLKINNCMRFINPANVHFYKYL